MSIVYGLIGLALFIGAIKLIGAAARGAWRGVPTSGHIARAIHDATPPPAPRKGTSAATANRPGNSEFDADVAELQRAFEQKS